MPDAGSMIRTVPGGNVGAPGGSVAGDDGDWAVGASGLDPPTSSAATTAATRPSTARPTIHAVRGPLLSDDGSTGEIVAGAAGGDGASSGEVWTATPGPAGVVTSAHADPLHHRTWPGAPSGSGYHPGGGPGGLCPVTGSP